MCGWKYNSHTCCMYTMPPSPRLLHFPTVSADANAFVTSSLLSSPRLRGRARGDRRAAVARSSARRQHRASTVAMSSCCSRRRAALEQGLGRAPGLGSFWPMPTSIIEDEALVHVAHWPRIAHETVKDGREDVGRRSLRATDSAAAVSLHRTCTMAHRVVVRPRSTSSARRRARWQRRRSNCRGGGFLQKQRCMSTVDYGCCTCPKVL